ncbi:UNKNOWN [Stylonychia lemnae]|uniref:Uncharacterized protein n=1 Tax=Stylonychia lemnae TaxID=5949 RepID=A0A078AMX8_STYLE|nr:UNKNOWN [Stylonychia lemnae]|eukprot:CDW82243.1 UNKNOWN [Stylonychia lemnae]
MIYFYIYYRRLIAISRAVGTFEETCSLTKIRNHLMALFIFMIVSNVIKLLPQFDFIFEFAFNKEYIEDNRESMLFITNILVTISDTMVIIALSQSIKWSILMQRNYIFTKRQNSIGDCSTSNLDESIDNENHDVQAVIQRENSVKFYQQNKQQKQIDMINTPNSSLLEQHSVDYYAFNHPNQIK